MSGGSSARAPWSFQAQRARWRIARAARRRLGLEKTVYVDQRTDEYRGYWSQAAAALGGALIELTPQFWEVRLDGRRTRIAGHLVQADDPVTLELAGDKGFCNEIARAAGVPVPDFAVFGTGAGDLRRASAWVQREPGYYVVKPVRGSAAAIGVTTGVHSAGGLVEAAALASLAGSDLMVQQMAGGEICRLLFLGGEMVHAVRRRGVRVRGDGQSSVRQLVERSGISLSPGDPDVAVTLACQGMQLASRPAEGQRVVVRGQPLTERGAREVRTIYDETITDLLAPELVAEVERIVRALGSELAGVDVMTPDVGASLAAAGGSFIEINTTPGLHHHFVPDDPEGGPRTARRIIQYLTRST